jgi:hypothetical protein
MPSRLASLTGNLFLVSVDHKDGVRQTLHLFDAREVLLQRQPLALDLQPLLLGVLLDAAIRLHRLDLLEPLDRLLNGLKLVRSPPSQRWLI